MSTSSRRDLIPLEGGGGRRVAVAVGAVALLVGAGVVALGSQGVTGLSAAGRAPTPSSAAPASSPSAPTVPEVAPSAATAPRRVQLVILPKDATAEIDGVKAEVRDGAIEITGAPGSVHRVRLTKDKGQVDSDVSVTEAGAMPPKLEIPSAKAAAPAKAAGKPPRYHFDE